MSTTKTTVLYACAFRRLDQPDAKWVTHDPLSEAGARQQIERGEAAEARRDTGRLWEYKLMKVTTTVTREWADA